MKRFVNILLVTSLILILGGCGGGGGSPYNSRYLSSKFRMANPWPCISLTWTGCAATMAGMISTKYRFLDNAQVPADPLGYTFKIYGTPLGQEPPCVPENTFTLARAIADYYVDPSDPQAGGVRMTGYYYPDGVPADLYLTIISLIKRDLPITLLIGRPDSPYPQFVVVYGVEWREEGGVPKEMTRIQIYDPLKYNYFPGLRPLPESIVKANGFVFLGAAWMEPTLVSGSQNGRKQPEVIDAGKGTSLQPTQWSGPSP